MKLVSNLLRRKTPKAYVIGSLIGVMQASELLQWPGLDTLITRIESLSQLPQDYFEAFYIDTLLRFAEHVQLIPTELNSPLGSLLTEGICRGLFAMEQLAERFDDPDPLHLYALFTSNLFQDISHTLIHQQVHLTNDQGVFLQKWNPFSYTIPQLGTHYRLLAMNPTFHRLDRQLRHVLARQIMPAQGYDWISQDLSLLCDWIDALSGDGSHGGLLAYTTSIIKRTDYAEMLALLHQHVVDPIKLPVTEHGEAFYRYLERQIAKKNISINGNDSPLHRVRAGLLISKKCFEDFAKVYDQPVSLAIVYEQFGNLMGIPEKGGQDLMHAQYFSKSNGRRGLLSGRTVSGCVIDINLYPGNNPELPAKTQVLNDPHQKGLLPKLNKQPLSNLVNQTS